MKLIDTELYELAIELADSAARSDIECLSPHITPFYSLRGDDLECFNHALRYLELREASGDPLPYKIIRDSGKVRFE